MALMVELWRVEKRRFSLDSGGMGEGVGGSVGWWVGLNRDDDDTCFEDRFSSFMFGNF
jgi:hypothetical protein